MHGSLRVGIVTAVQHFDPYGAMDYVGGVVCGQVFQPPFGYLDAGSDIRPVVFAGPLRMLSDTRWVGRLRPGIRFSDGSAVKPSDVVASLRRAWTKERRVTVWETGDQVEFEFAEPMLDPHVALVPTWCAISKNGDGIIGSGAYIRDPSSTPDELRLLRNPHYGGEQGAATIQEVTLKSYDPDQQGTSAPLLAAIEAGEIDFTQVISRDEAASLPVVRKLYQPGSSTAILFLNCERLADRQVRASLIASVDRYAITRLCYDNPAGFVARGLLPPRMGSFGDGVAPRPPDAGVLDGLPTLRLVVIWAPRPYLSKPKQVADNIVEQLAAVGVSVEVEFADDGDHYFREIDAGKYDLMLSGWIADSGDAADFLTSLLHSDCVRRPGDANPAACNLSRWSDGRADALLAEMRQGDREAAPELVRRVGEEAPMLPLMYGPSVTVASRRVRAFTPHPLNIYPLFAELELED